METSLIFLLFSFQDMQERNYEICSHIYRHNGKCRQNGLFGEMLNLNVLVLRELNISSDEEYFRKKLEGQILGKNCLCCNRVHSRGRS